jgi:hypothetical protein
MEETSYFTGAVTYSITWAYFCGAPAPEPAPAVVTKEYEWSLGGITEDVTLTYTNPDGTTGGLSDYYGALGSQYIFCARQNTATASHGIITLMGECRSTSPYLHQHQHQHLSLSLSLHQLLEEH